MFVSTYFYCLCVFILTPKHHNTPLFHFSTKIPLLVYIFVFFYFHYVVRSNSKVHVVFSFLINFRCDHSPGLRDPFVSQCPPPLKKHVSFSWTYSRLCIDNFVIWSRFNLLDNSQWMSFSTLPCLVQYCCSVTLLNSLIFRYKNSSLSPNNLF